VPRNTGTPARRPCTDGRRTAIHDAPAGSSRREQPWVVELRPGRYACCACGRSRNAPFCDGSHAGSGVEPRHFEVKGRTRLLWLCGCGRSARLPFCDGSHNRRVRE